MEAVILPPSWESRQTWGGLQESSLEKRPDPKAMQLLWMEEAKAEPLIPAYDIASRTLAF